MADLCSVVPPPWVNLSTFLEEKLTDREFHPWWNSEFTGALEIVDGYGIEDNDSAAKQMAVPSKVGSIQVDVLPGNILLSGAFQLDFKLVADTGVINFCGFQLLTSGGSLVTRFGLDDNGGTEAFRFWTGTLTVYEDLTGFQKGDQYTLRIKRPAQSSTISFYVYDNWGESGVPTLAYELIGSATSATSGDDLKLEYLADNQAGTNNGLASMELQCSSALPCLLTPNAVRNAEVMNRCYHYGFNEKQGGGWDEIEDGAWVWPANQASVLSLIDSNGFRRLSVWDWYTGLRYAINTLDGPPGSGLVWRNKDKVDPNIADSGTHIPCRFKRREDLGEMQHYTSDHMETFIHFRTMKADNRSASGYTADGLLSVMTVNMLQFNDGSETYSAIAEQIPFDREMDYDRITQGHTQQTEFQTTTSDWRVVRVEQYYSIYDKALFPGKNSNDLKMSERTYQEELRVPQFWVTQNSSRPALNRATTRIESIATFTTVTGANGRANAAIQITGL